MRLVNEHRHADETRTSVILVWWDGQGFRVRGFGANGGPDPYSGGHEAVPMSGRDVLAEPARWWSNTTKMRGHVTKANNHQTSSHENTDHDMHGLADLMAGDYMVRVFLVGNATLYSLTFEGCQ